MQTLNNIVGYFLNSKFYIDTSVYQKARISVIVFLIVYVITIIYVSIYFTLSKGIYNDFKSFLNYADFAATTIALIIIKKTGKVDFSLAFMAFAYFILISLSIYISGGINSYDIFWLIVLCAAVFMFVSEQIGIITTILCLVIITLFYLMDQFEFHTFQTTEAETTISYKYYNFLLILCLLILMIYVLIKGNKKLLAITKLIEEKKQREETAREFHDQIGNKLASISNLTTLVKLKKTDAEKQNVLDQITASSNDLYDNFRDFIWAKDPKSDYSHELFMYLRDYLDDYLKHANIKLYIETEPNILPEIKLPTSYIREILPIVKESITNIIKHAQAQTIWFSFQITQNQLKIMVMDDGIGKIEDLNKSGNGLKNMLHRAHKIDAQFEISQNKPQGIECTFICKLPE